MIPRASFPVICSRAFVILLFLVAAASVRAQSVVVRVIDQHTNQPLMNAELIYRGPGGSRLTDQRGEARLVLDASDPLQLRVRQIGYRFVDTTLRAPTIGSQVTIAMERVAYVLPAVAATAADACDERGDSASSILTATALEQLKMGAERYRTFRTEYPFRITQERFTKRFSESGKVLRMTAVTEQENSERWGDPYKPGSVVIYSGLGFSVQILFLANLADPLFWTNHCFAARPMVWEGSTVVRIDFSPVRTIRSPDWAGWAILDPASSVLRRIEFRLVGLTPTSSPNRLEGFTSFMSPSDYIVVPESSAAMWWRSAARARQTSWPDVLQVLHLKELKYRKKSPDDSAARPR